MCNGCISDNTSSCQPRETEVNSCTKPCEKNVLVVFSSVNLRTLEECGREKAETDEEGNSVTVVKHINVMEWAYSPKNYTPKDILDCGEKIFVDCSDVVGTELYQACGGVTRESEAYAAKAESVTISKQVMSNPEDVSGLIAELVFATSQLKDFLFQLQKDGYIDGGDVTLRVCAIHPVECLLFAFLKILGLYVEKQELYGKFCDKAFANPVLKKTQDWLEQRHWKIKVEYCSVSQIYIQEVQMLTEKGKREKRKKEVEELKKRMEDIRYKWIQVVNKRRLSNGSWIYPEEYSSLLKGWTDLGKDHGIHRGSGVFHKDYGELGYQEVDYPALEYEWNFKYDSKTKSYVWVYEKGMHTYDWYEAILNKIEIVEKQPPTSEELERRKKEFDEAAAKLSKELRREEREFHYGRGAEITQKKQ